MIKLAWSMKTDWKSVWFEGVLVPLWLFPAGASVSISVDFAFSAFAGHISLEYGTHDLVCNGRMRNFRCSTRCLWAATLGWSLST